MNRRLASFTLIVILSITPLFAQEAAVKNAIESFKTGSVKNLSALIDDNTKVYILNQSSITKDKSLSLLNSFFSKNKVKNFEIIHQGKRSNSCFIIGLLTTTVKKFRVNCFFKINNNKNIIHQIRIDKTDD